MGLFTDEYKKLLIIQYADKPNALAQIELTIKKLEETYDLALSLEQAFDLDQAEGKQLDTLGKIVGINRSVPIAVIPKNYFGFEGHDDAWPMDDKFTSVVSYPMKNKFEIHFSTNDLNDYTYRFFMKAQIIKNHAKGTMIDENNLSIQNAIDYLFDNKAFVVDNKNMSMNIYINNTFDFNMVQYIEQLDLIPRPQGVRYRSIISYVDGNTFGFNPSDTGFGDKFSGIDDQTYFAIKII